MSLPIRQQLGRIKNRAQEIFDRYDDLSPKWNNVTVEAAAGILPSIENQLKRLKEKFQQWQSFVDRIEEEEDRLKEKELFNEWKEDDDYANLLEDLEEAVATTNRISSVSSARDASSMSIAQLVPVKIAAQNMQKFDGNYLSWKPFWQRFELNIDSKQYAEIDKLDALFGLLEGKALKEVEGTPIISENYDAVKKMLFDRFGNDNQILYALQNQLSMIQPARDNAESLRDTVTSIHRLCRQLKNLGVDINNASLKLDIIKKMPTREQAELLLLTRSQADFSTEDILKKMKEYECRAEIVAEIEGKHFYCSDSFLSRIPSTSKQLYCSFCDGGHPSATCEKFKSLDDRLQQLKVKGSCFKCAGRNHSSRNCRSHPVCKSCNGEHQTFLCKAGALSKSTNVKTKVFVAVEKKQSPLLAKEIIVKNPETKKEAKAVIFLDSGSQKNFISNDLMNKLKLKPMAKEVLTVEDFGGQKTRQNSNIVELRIPTVDGSHVDIVANSISNIATSVPMVEMDDRDPEQYSIVKKTPDILVGMENFFSIVTAAKEENGIVIIDSKIGTLMSGKLDRVQQKEQSTLSCAAVSSYSAAGEGLVELDEWWKLHRMKHGMAQLGIGQFEFG